MNKFRPTFWSLGFPVGIFLYSVFYLVKLWRLGFGPGSGYSVGWSFVAAAVVGGALPFALSFLLNADTREYFLPRLIIFLTAFVLAALARELAAMPKAGTVLVYAADAVVTAVFFLRIQRTSFNEWIIIFCSTPAIYMMLYYILLEGDIQLA